jgi:hypothetical protein
LSHLGHFPNALAAKPSAGAPEFLDPLFTPVEAGCFLRAGPSAEWSVSAPVVGGLNGS